MFLRKAALRAVPKWAVVDEDAVESVERSLSENDAQLQEALDDGYRELDRKQPALAEWLAEQVSGRTDELAQSLGYFLAVTVYLAFRESFPTRLKEVDNEALGVAVGTLETDEELRANDPTEVLDSDDVVRLGQPAVVDWVQHHLQEALEQADESTNLEDLDEIYRAILIEVISLSHAVASPHGNVNEILA